MTQSHVYFNLSLTTSAILSGSQGNPNAKHTYITNVTKQSICDKFQQLFTRVPTGSPSRGGDVAVYVSDINQPSLPALFYAVLVSISVFVALSTVFLSINSPDNSLLSQSVLLVLFLPYWSFHLSSALVKSFVVEWAKALYLSLIHI